jgi:hypothetical protein
MTRKCNIDYYNTATMALLDKKCEKITSEERELIHKSINEDKLYFIDNDFIFI